MSKKHKKICRGLYYIEHLLILISRATGCVSISAFASLVGIPIGITISAVGFVEQLQELKRYKSIE